MKPACLKHVPPAQNGILRRLWYKLWGPHIIAEIVELRCGQCGSIVTTKIQG